MRKKNVLLMSLVIPLFFSMSIVRVGATPVVWVDPPEVTVPFPGQTFSVNITISNVTSLYGYEFTVFWDKTLLNCTGFVETPPAVWGTSWYSVGPGVVQDYNATHGEYDKATLALAPAPAFTGSWVVLTLTFNATAMGGPSPLILYDTKLADFPGGNPIAHTSDGGSVEVLPEFPDAIVLPLFLIAALVAVIMGKVAWKRKRRESFVAK